MLSKNAIRISARITSINRTELVVGSIPTGMNCMGSSFRLSMLSEPTWTVQWDICTRISTHCNLVSHREESHHHHTISTINLTRTPVLTRVRHIYTSTYSLPCTWRAKICNRSQSRRKSLATSQCFRFNRICSGQPLSPPNNSTITTTQVLF